MANITNLPAPRVPFLDERTGLMSREWYRFFLNMFLLTGAGTSGTSLVDVQIGPEMSAYVARYDEAIKSIQGLKVEPVSIPQDRLIEQSNTVLTWLSVQ